MVKKVFYIILTLVFITILKYFISDYTIKYKIDSFNIEEIYNNGKFTINIKEDNLFQIVLYQKRGIQKKLINKIEEIKSDNVICYNVIINKENNVSCFQEKEPIAFYLIEDENIKSQLQNLDLNFYYEQNEPADFKFYNNLEDNVFVALWNYKGFYIMNGENITNLDLLQKERYDNSLCILKDEYLIFPNYDKNHEFEKLYKVNLKSEDVSNIETPKIDYDYYWSGEFKNNLYLYDEKYSLLYEINVKKEKANLIGSENKGYIKIKNNKKVTALKKEYENKITYFEKNISNYEVSDAVYKVYNDDFKVKIFNTADIKIIKEYKDSLYFLYKDNLYSYNSKGIKKILHFFELNFNKENMLYVYIDN